MSSQHSPNTVTRHNSIGHGVVGVNMVVKGCSSQHTASKRLSRDETFRPRNCEHHPPTVRSLHRRTRAVSQLLPISDPNNWIVARVLLKLLSFFIRKFVNHHSCQPVEYCSWNVFRQQICHVLQHIQLVQRDETESSAPPSVSLCALVQAVA